MQKDFKNRKNGLAKDKYLKNRKMDFRERKSASVVIISFCRKKKFSYIYIYIYLSGSM